MRTQISSHLVDSGGDGHRVPAGRHHGDVRGAVVLGAPEVCLVVLGRVEGAVVVDTGVLVLGPGLARDVGNKFAEMLRYCDCYRVLLLVCLLDKVSDVLVEGVPQVAPRPVAPLEALHHPLVQEPVLGLHGVGVEDLEDGGEHRATGGGRHAVQGQGVL